MIRMDKFCMHAIRLTFYTAIAERTYDDPGRFRTKTQHGIDVRVRAVGPLKWGSNGPEMVAANVHPECARRAGRHGCVSNAGGESWIISRSVLRRAQKIEPSTGFGVAATRAWLSRESNIRWRYCSSCIRSARRIPASSSMRCIPMPGAVEVPLVN